MPRLPPVISATLPSTENRFFMAGDRTRGVRTSQRYPPVNMPVPVPGLRERNAQISQGRVLSRGSAAARGRPILDQLSSATQQSPSARQALWLAIWPLYLLLLEYLAVS